MAIDPKDFHGDDNDEPTAPIEVVQLTALEATERASIDIQIATAKRYPRSLQAFKKRAIDMATIDEETAESCLYRRPVGKEKDPKTSQMVQKFAEGMSVRMAEIVGACYGNLRVKAFMLEENPRFVKACGQAIDLETNFASSSEALESTIDKNGHPYSERTRLLTGKVALAKARRDATFQVVPRALARPVEVAVRALLMGSVETLNKRREKVMSWIAKLGIDPKRVYAALGIAGDAELGAEQLEVLTGIRTAIKDKEATLDEAFPIIGATDRKGGIADIIGKPAEAPPDAPSANPTASEPQGRVYTPGERDDILRAVEDLMLTHGVTESAVMTYAHGHKLAVAGQDEVGALSTEALDALRAVVPGLKGGAK